MESMKADMAANDKNEPMRCPKQVTIDEAMDTTGSMVRIQLFYQIFFTLVIAACSYQATSTVFTGDSPSWRCQRNNSSQFCQQNFGLEIISINLNFTKRCELERDEWEYSKPKSYSYVTQFDLVCKQNYLAALIEGSFFIGLVISAIFCGTLSDIYGRKKVYPCFLLLFVVSSIASSFANDPWLLFALRFIVGFGSSAGWGSFVYLAELMPPKRRTICINGSNIGFPLGALFVVGIAFLEPNWKNLQLYISLPGILALLTCFVIPESPYWLISAGKKTEAENIIRNIARMNGKVFDTDTTLVPSSTTKLLSASDGKKYTYIDLCRHWKVALLVSTLNLLWFSIALIYFTTTFQVSNLGGNIYTSFVLIAIPDIPSIFLPMYLCDRFGRKKTVLLCCVTSGIMSSIIAIVTWQFSSVYLLNIILSFCGKLSLNAAYNGLGLWQFELYPTVLRSQGSSVGMIAENIGSSLAPLVSDILHDVNPALPYLVMGVFGISAPILGLVLPESKGRPTRENYQDFFVKRPKNIHINNAFIVE